MLSGVKDAKRAGLSYWKLSPEKKGRLWPTWRDGGFVSIGWNELGDLSGVDKAEFDRRVDKVRETHPTWKRRGLEQVWKFAGIKVGDRVIANLGTKRVLGIGTITGEYEFVADEGEEHRHRIPVRWDDVEEKKVEKLGWRRTLIKLKRAEFEEIARGTIDDGEDEDEETAEDVETFADILSAIETEGLHFPEELVANFVLALQAKRFALLTGISGTGKTQIALTLAKHFAPSSTQQNAAQPAPQDGEGVHITVKPYMTKYKRAVVPVELAVPFLAAREDESRTRWLPIELPSGEKMSIAAYTKEGSNLLYALFRGASADWAKALSVGQLLRLTRLDEPEPVGTLRFEVPGQGEDPQPPAATATTIRTYEVIAVRPDWSDNAGLLGFYNPLTARYTMRPFLRLALNARDEWVAAKGAGRAPGPFFAILDEMNLARVEHYFSDVLSAMESDEPIELHEDQAVEEGETEDGVAVPRSLVLPPNLFIVGTVNVDETTYMFSPKVLDRAFTIEFNDVALSTYGEVLDEDPDAEESPSETPLTLDQFEGVLRFRRNPSPDDWKQFCGLGGGSLRERVIRLNEILSAENRHFGYRVVNEIARFVCLAHEQTSEAEPADIAAFDLAVLQKVLPKLHGTQQELEDVLVDLFRFAMNIGEGDPADFHVVDGTLAKKKDGEQDVNGGGSTSEASLPRTAMKLWRMCRRVRQQGFVSFIE